MCIDPESAGSFSTGQVNLPDPLERYRLAKFGHALATVALVAQQVVQIEQYAAIGGFGDLGCECAIRHFTRTPGEVTDRHLECDRYPGGQATAADLLSRNFNPALALRRRQKEACADNLIRTARAGKYKLIEAEVIADPGRLQRGNIAGERLAMAGGLPRAATKRRADTVKQLRLRQMLERCGK